MGEDKKSKKLRQLIDRLHRHQVSYMEMSRIFLKTRRAVVAAKNWIELKEPKSPKEVVIKHLSDILEEVERESLALLESESTYADI